MAPPAERLTDQPPSAKLVFKMLEYDGSLTQKELADETMLPQRTVRFALSRLEEVDLVEDRVSFRDARQSVYSLTDAGERATPSDVRPNAESDARAGTERGTGVGE
ncbi:winged helix-turn-helix transcriptional regulator [Natrialbaceae archaeon GCM10025810]|uniref:winged helix-turn-helix transcriptional regulator n=1 Tax=Halovalidus salilacus TaxID=3075124 RepID=UPI0036071F83